MKKRLSRSEKTKVSRILLILIVKKLQDLASLIIARNFGNASGMQVPRHVGLVHGENLLDATAELPPGRRQFEGSFRRCFSGDGQ